MENRNYVPSKNTIQRHLLQHLEEEKYRFINNPEEHTITLVLPISPVERVVLQFFVFDKSYIIRTYLPIAARNESQRRRAAEFIAYVNYGMYLGAFEMDMEDGQIQYRVFTDCMRRLPSADVIENGIMVSFAMVRQFINGFLSVLFTDESPENVYLHCETDDYLPTPDMN